MKSPQKSRFGKLVTYLLDPQSKKTRVGEVVITNCASTDTTWASREIAATQWLNTRAKSARTYHLIISLRAGLAAALFFSTLHPSGGLGDRGVKIGRPAKLSHRQQQEKTAEAVM